MRLKVLALEFLAEGKPANPELLELAQKFAAVHLAAPPEFERFRRVRVVAQLDDDGKPKRVVGLLGMCLRVDYCLVRFILPEAGEMLIDRERVWLEENGATGQDVLIYLGAQEEEGQRCPGWQKFLDSLGAVPADRWKVNVGLDGGAREIHN